MTCRYLSERKRNGLHIFIIGTVPDRMFHLQKEAVAVLPGQEKNRWTAGGPGTSRAANDSHA